MLRDFFRGRYGIDMLSLVLIIGSLVLLKDTYLWVVGVVIIGFVIYRGFSRNINQRREELNKFNSIMGSAGRLLTRLGAKSSKGMRSLINKTNLFFTKTRQRKFYVFMKCPNCSNNLRLPRNKGKIQIKCPVCKNEFIKKT